MSKEREVRAFQPRQDTGGVWRCRGRVPETRPPTRYSGKTKQCVARLEPGQTWCRRCGGLIAWGGEVQIEGKTLKHLERTHISVNLKKPVVVQL